MATIQTTINSRATPYRDIAFSFSPNPNTGDISLKRDVEAVRQSVLNIIMTSRGERPFQPQLGGSLREYLFEQFDNLLTTTVRDHIKSVLQDFEPRVKIIDIAISERPDSNQMTIILELIVKSHIDQQTTIEFTIERIR